MIRTAAALAPLLLCAGFSGCFWLVAGGAGAEAGYVAGQDDRSAGQTMSDQWIFAKVKSELLAAGGVPSGKIEVKVRKGAVTLTGVVASEDQKSKAIEITAGVKGVKKVVDKLYVSE